MVNFKEYFTENFQRHAAEARENHKTIDGKDLYLRLIMAEARWGVLVEYLAQVDGRMDGLAENQQRINDAMDSLVKTAEKLENLFELFNTLSSLKLLQKADKSKPQ